MSTLQTNGGQCREKRFGFAAIYTPIEDGWYFSRVLELPEAISQGETLEEAREMLARLYPARS